MQGENESMKSKLNDVFKIQWLHISDLIVYTQTHLKLYEQC